MANEKRPSADQAEGKSTSKEKDSPPRKVAQVQSIHENPVTYYPDELQEFLDEVFHAPAGQPLVWYTPSLKAPGYPSKPERMMRTLERSTEARALYVGTSTVHPLPDGSWRNRKSQFSALHVVVLDDIGTKVKTLPEALQKPSYRLETSQGNYQYGYILAEPVRSLEAAQALIREVYGSGYTDAGGAIVTKVVRLPGGVNGKEGRRQYFEVVHVDEPSWRHWTPEELLEAVGSDLDWQAAQADAQTAERAAGVRSVRTWAPQQPEGDTADGLLDPVLEWLYERGEVVADRGHVVDIVCPWAEDHSDGSELAGYFPLGRGPKRDSRLFHCFHDHCKLNTTPAYLAHVSSIGGPEVSVFDPSAELTARWVYDPRDDVAYEVVGVKTLEPLKLTALKNLNRQKISTLKPDGKLRARSVVDAWLDNPYKVVAYGRICDPSTSAPVVTYEDRLRINIFRRPEWGGPIHESDLKMWMRFMRYLIPIKEEREFFFDWLAAKFQDMAFRGPGILMVAEAFGTGRGTLAKMLTTLFGVGNVSTVPWATLVGDKNHNEWQESILAITHETLDASTSTSMFRAYEQLKTVIETSPSQALINPKHVSARNSPVYTSHILFSNHENAIIIPEGDRRLYVITNPSDPAEPEFFTELYAWLEEKPTAWPHAIATWLREREVNPAKLLAPAPMTKGKEQMLTAGMSGLDLIMKGLSERWDGSYVATPIIREALQPYRAVLKIDPSVQGNKHIEHAIKRVTVAVDARVSLEGKQYRVRRLRRDTHKKEGTQGDMARDIGVNTVEKIRGWVDSILAMM